MEARFPPSYPAAPFFLRVVTPRMVMCTGHVHIFGQFKNMFITSQYRQHASHALASRAYGPQPHMRSFPTAQDHT